MNPSEMPKELVINRPLFEIQLGLRPLYHMALVNQRTLAVKMGMAFLETDPHGLEMLKAPRGHRIMQVWKGTIKPENEITVG